MFKWLERWRAARARRRAANEFLRGYFAAFEHYKDAGQIPPPAEYLRWYEADDYDLGWDRAREEMEDERTGYAS